ncbi:MAG TPA: PIG-L family deacetylase [Candidatus Limnocylindria bacterium]|nr:PIG-L family deacetylase [Candidatus Limnocylindria bacterium]
MKPRALAIAAHPDDIEFTMAGTLLRLGEVGYELHYMNLSTGSLGSAEWNAAKTRVARGAEAKRAAKTLGAHWHGPLCDDLEILYELKTLRRLAAVIRDVAPQIILTHPPVDYMEDHTETCRLVVTAAFSRGMPNFVTTPKRKAVDGEVTIYHSQPHLNRDPLGQLVHPEFYVDVENQLATQRQALAEHRSQKEWLDTSQGMDSYLATMENLKLEVGRMSRCFKFAEGWRRHLYAGFCSPEADPLRAALKTGITQSAAPT